MNCLQELWRQIGHPCTHLLGYVCWHFSEMCLCDIANNADHLGGQEADFKQDK
jgi:hypothetical protein